VIANEVAQHFKLSSAKTVPIYNGVDTRVFCPRQTWETFPWQVWIAGGVRDVRYRAALEALVTELGLTDQVRWLGFVDEVELVALYQGAKAFVTASRDEGFNIPPLEAMASGCPVLCSDIPVHRELFDGAALFFPAESSEALAQGLLRLHDDVAQGEQLRQQARLCVERLSWSAMARRVATALRTLRG